MSKPKDDKADAKAADARLRALKNFDLEDPKFPPELEKAAL